MSGKLKGLRAVNTNTLTNPYCNVMRNVETPSVICKICYSGAMLEGSRKNCVPSFERNSEWLSSKAQYDFPTTNDAWFRLHGHGELINIQHLDNLNSFVLSNPQTTFTLWTKRKDYIKTFYNKVEKPSNLLLVFSNPVVDRVRTSLPPYFDKVFNNVTGENPLENCTGKKCLDCKLCYTKNDTTVIVEKSKIRH